MALVLADRVQQTGTANTTVSFTLSGAVTGFQSFTVVGNGNTTYYSATDASGNWEVGIGTYATGGTLTRTTILSSSNTGTAVTFSGAVNVFVTYPSGKSVNLDASGNATALGTPASGTLTNCTFPTLNQNTTGSSGSVANALTINSPLTGTSYNGSGAVSIGIPAATTSVSGYLTSTDWNTFNGKQAAGTYVTSGGALGTPSSGTLTNCTFPTLNQSTTGSAATFTSTTQNSQFNSVGVGTAGSATAGEIRATNNVTAYYSSDRTLKENIQDIPNALEIAVAIGSKTFDWTDAYLEAHGGVDGYFVQKSDFGVIAQDVQEVFPMAVRTREDGTLAVDYEKLGTLAFAAIGQLLKRIEALEAK